MLPAFLVRACIDWVRTDPRFKDSNPYSRCEEALKIARDCWQQEFGQLERLSLEPAILIAYWQEFFHAENPMSDEHEWREGLTKRSSPYTSFEEWQDWFRQNYAEVYQENDIWKSVIMTAWANTHQFVVNYQNGNWRFIPSKSYLPTTAMWSLEPHLSLVQDTLRRVWGEELNAYSAAGFQIKDEAGSVFGNLECLGFDGRIYTLYFPSRTRRDPVIIDAGDMVADIVAPISNEWYRRLDHVIFADGLVDITALTNRARYIFSSRRRMYELLIGQDNKSAYLQAATEGWLVEEKV